MADSKLLEANSSFIEAWKYWAHRARAGEVRELPGVTVAWSNVSWLITNLTFLSRIVRDEADLVERIETALAHAEKRDLGWVFFVCDDWLPEKNSERTQEVFSRYGLVPALSMTAMMTDEILPARRPLPQLEIRRVQDSATRKAVGEINCIAYGMPVEWGHEALDVETVWDEASFGYVGYVGGEAVATATTVLINGSLYVGLVATLPDHQRRGYGEAVMRYSLEKARAASGYQHTVLHATEAGFPLYQEMGYHGGAIFSGYVIASE